jgi:hypothetical protein
MSKQSVTKGATSQIHYVWIRDSSSSVGAGLTGLVFNSGSLVASYVRPAAARTAITLATQTTTGAFSSGGFVEIDATNMPGLYRLDVPDAVFASGVNSAVVMLKGATNMEPCVIEYELKTADLQDGVRAGLTALPNAAAEAAGGLYTRGTGAGQINQPANGMIDVNTVRNAGTAIVSAAGRQEVNLTHVNGTAATSAAGRPEVNTTHLAGQAVTAAAGVTFPTSVASPTNITAATGITVSTNNDKTGYGLSSAAVQAIWDALTSALTTAGSIGKKLADWVIGTSQTGDAYARLGAPAGASVSADIAAAKADTAAIKTKTDFLPSATAGAAGGVFIAGSNAATTVNITGNITGNVSGSVGSVTGATGSVTGAVGSVTGNVGGNVTGSVGSVASGGISEASFATTAGSFSPLGIIDQGTAQAATSTTLQIRAAATFADNVLAGSVVAVLGSTQGYWQTVSVISNVSSTDTLTVSTFPVTPSGTITYKIFASPPADGSSVWASVVDGTTTAAESIRLLNSAAAGKVSGAGTTTVVIRDLADSKDRVTATVDSSGNRSAVTRNVTL